MDSIDARRDVIAMRTKHGAESRIGRWCSLLVEQLDNYEAETDEPTKEILKRLIGTSVAELAKLTKAA